MPTIETSIEIAASPSAVRAVLLDWPSYPSWNDNFRIAPPEGKKPEETQIKDALKVEVVGGMKFSPSVTRNEENAYSWAASMFGLFSGEHQFYFKPSEITPGHTTLVHREDFAGLFGFLMSEGRSGGAKAKADYARFNESLKKEVEKRASA